ncbi:hypothetical protein DFP72DRAFT_809721, partial [Ephemerocybe angulata]
MHVKVKEAENRNFVARYLRYNNWGFSTPIRTSKWSEIAKPLPSPPHHVLEDPDVTSTLESHPHLFRIVTPINIDRFEQLLSSHPNRPFVDSVLDGLRNGFWPWASYPTDYPSTHEASTLPPQDETQREFLFKQRDIELEKGRYSEGLRALLPGMKTTPILAVPKDGGSDLRMVTNHSKEPYPQNGMVDKEAMGKVPLDGMRVLG